MSDLELFRDLRDRQAERRVADLGLFFAESPEVISRIGRSGGRIVHVVASERRARRLDSMSLGDATVSVLSEDALYSLVGFEMHRGMIASVERPTPPRLTDIDSSPMVGVLEGINDHQNLGAIVRSGVALGVSGFVLDPTTADPFYRRSVRVSMGTVTSVPLVRVDSWPNAVATLDWARKVALTPAGEQDLFALEVTGPVAIMLGAEGSGLSPAALRMADVRARIPMEQEVDSINVSHAAAIAFAHFRSGLGRSRTS